jgi:hypothetical protein
MDWPLDLFQTVLSPTTMCHPEPQPGIAIINYPQTPRRR